MRTLLILDAELAPNHPYDYSHSTRVTTCVLGVWHRFDHILVVDRANERCRQLIHQQALTQYIARSERLSPMLDDLKRLLHSQCAVEFDHIIWLSRSQEGDAHELLQQALNWHPVRVRLSQKLITTVLHCQHFSALGQRTAYYLWLLCNGCNPAQPLQSPGQINASDNEILSTEQIRARLTAHQSTFYGWILTPNSACKNQTSDQLLLAQLEKTPIQLALQQLFPKASCYVYQLGQWQEKTAWRWSAFWPAQLHDLQQALSQQADSLPIMLQFNGPLEQRLNQPWFAHLWQLLQEEHQLNHYGALSLEATTNFGSDAVVISLDHRVETTAGKQPLAVGLTRAREAFDVPAAVVAAW